MKYKLFIVALLSSVLFLIPVKSNADNSENTLAVLKVDHAFYHSNSLNFEIKYQISNVTNLKITLYREDGLVYKVLEDQIKKAGDYSLLFDKNKIPDGNYVCMFEVGDIVYNTYFSVNKGNPEPKYLNLSEPFIVESNLYIQYELRSESHVKLYICDQDKKCLKVIDNGFREEGKYRFNIKLDESTQGARYYILESDYGTTSRDLENAIKRNEG